MHSDHSVSPLLTFGGQTTVDFFRKTNKSTMLSSFCVQSFYSFSDVNRPKQTTFFISNKCSQFLVDVYKPFQHLKAMTRLVITCNNHQCFVSTVCQCNKNTYIVLNDNIVSKGICYYKIVAFKQIF